MSLDEPERQRTIETRSPVAPEYVRGGRPVLAADPSHGWENRVVLNPAAVLVESGPELEALFEAWDLPEGRRVRLRDAGGACVMLYRAQGERDPAKNFHPSYLGLAVLTPQLDPCQRWPTPVIEPREDYHSFGVEDPRCTRVGDTYYVYYTGYSALRQFENPAERVDDSAAGRDDGSAAGTGDDSAADHVGAAGQESAVGVEGVTRICLATTKNFVDWDLHGPASGDLNDVSNKNAALFPVPVHGKWLLLHRPMAGPDAMTIHLAESDDPGGPWTTRGRFMESFPYREFARSWIGAGGPPVSLGDDRFLMIYHQGHFTPEGGREYDLAAALIDFNAPDPVLSRIEPLMRPSRGLERRGDPVLGVDNVLFTCANYRWKDKLMVPYAGSDSRIFGSSFPFDRLLAALESKAE